MFVVCVTFVIKPGAMARFLPLMEAQADTSLREEEGCLRFDICGGGAKDTVVLYEIYTDAAAFDRHLASAHFVDFDAKVADLVAEKDVRTFNRLREAAG